MKLPHLSRRRLIVLLLVLVLLSPLAWISAKLVMSPHSSIWFPTVIKGSISGNFQRADETTDLFFFIGDHWEPGRGEKRIQGARAWLARYKEIAARHRDSDGRIFQYTWFYPIDNMEETILWDLAAAAHEGFGEVEVHWHHGHDSRDSFIADLRNGLELFKKTGALISEVGGEPRWCFIHGNWTLDNSGDPRHCGINDEIAIFQEHGCYADMTFPALGQTAQPSMINRIFYVEDTPEPKSYDRGVPARAGHDGTGFMIFHGPLGFNLRNPLILIENGAIDDAEGTGFSGKLRPPRNYRDYFKPSRVPVWDNIHVSVDGRPEWCFVKVHAHGMQHAEVLLGGLLDSTLDALEDYCEQRKIRLHYVTAREAYNLVKAAEQNLTGPPTEYYDLVVPPPLNRTLGMRVVESADEVSGTTPDGW